MFDTCICCGDPVPEGRMVCWICELKSELQSENKEESFMYQKNTENGYIVSLASGVADCDITEEGYKSALNTLG